MTESKQPMTGWAFINAVLTGTALAVIVALIPNAVLSEIFKYLIGSGWTALEPLAAAARVFQYGLPLMAGVLIALQFQMNPMQAVTVGGAAFLGSGAWRVVPVDGVATTQLVGVGDMLNTMLTAAVAVLFIRALGNRLGSLTLILLPILVGLGAGFVGVLTLPYVSAVTQAAGQLVNGFTELAPLPMSILIGMSFSLFIVSPLSTVALSLAIGLDGVAAGASAMGVAATTAVLVVSSWKVNRPGVTLAIALGSMKMMMPNFFRRPIMAVAFLANAVVSAIPVALVNVTGTPASGGFGLVGLIGPIASLPSLGLPMMLVVWIVVPFASAYALHWLFTKVLKLYSPEIFKFEVTR
ncbi:PTS sugar transporter subunit IIC [Streptococcus sp. 121]|uniref:PTS transporter subunit IIC n=1 Tax=Streptococcus sp. 121 TaxID=2797637 RepID=UPI0018F07C23|nr:PTS sugar transporter subunit IIC [Streptococcus sp. 121]MBJ6745681.1 PTS sugar transporter subunit IIC [Streptococcus sp. 121]